MLRPTGSRWPIDPAVSEACALPFGVLIAPLAPSPKPRFTPLSESDLTETARATHIAAAAPGAHDIPRCRPCGGYISAKCNMNARYWRCALCDAKNDLPSRYSSTVLSAASDAIEHVPEISRDVYDVPVFDNPATHDKGAVPPAAYIFLIDESGDQQYLDAARTAVKSALDVIEGESLVGVMLYSEYLSFLDVRGGQPLLRRVSALDDDVPIPEVFPPDQWLSLTSGKGVNQAIIEALSKLSPTPANKRIKRALGPAVKAALDLIERAELLAARCVVIGAGEPNFGLGEIRVPDHNATVKDRFPSPVEPFFADQGARASLLGAMIDLYLVSRMPIDVASISPVAQISGGRLILYESGESRLPQDVWQHLNDPAVVRGLLRLRCSKELKVLDLHGGGVYRDLQVPDVFRLSCHGHTSTLAAELDFATPEGLVKGSSAPCVQVAFRGVFLEPGMLPQRVLRVETQTYPASSSKKSICGEADANAVTTLVFHKAIAKADKDGIGEARMLLFDWLANLLAKTAIPSADGKKGLRIDPSLLNYPSLKMIPRVVFGLIRSFLFRQESVSPDVRASLRCIWEDLSPELLAAAAYPRLFSFLNLDEKSIKALALSSLEVKQSGHPIFMLDAFSEVVIYYAQANRRDLTFPPPESSLIMRLRAANIRDRPITPKCIICREGTSKDRWFKSLLIEDPVPGAAAQSFSAFIQGVTDSAQELLGATLQ